MISKCSSKYLTFLNCFGRLNSLPSKYQIYVALEMNSLELLQRDELERIICQDTDTM